MKITKLDKDPVALEFNQLNFPDGSYFNHGGNFCLVLHWYKESSTAKVLLLNTDEITTFWNSKAKAYYPIKAEELKVSFK